MDWKRSNPKKNKFAGASIQNTIFNISKDSQLKYISINPSLVQNLYPYKNLIIDKGLELEEPELKTQKNWGEKRLDTQAIRDRLNLLKKKYLRNHQKVNPENEYPIKKRAVKIERDSSILINGIENDFTELKSTTASNPVIILKFTNDLATSPAKIHKKPFRNEIIDFSNNEDDRATLENIITHERISNISRTSHRSRTPFKFRKQVISGIEEKNSSKVSSPSTPDINKKYSSNGEARRTLKQELRPNKINFTPTKNSRPTFAMNAKMNFQQFLVNKPQLNVVKPRSAQKRPNNPHHQVVERSTEDLRYSYNSIHRGDQRLLSLNKSNEWKGSSGLRSLGGNSSTIRY